MMLCACVHEGDVLLHAPTRQLNPCFSSNEATFTFLRVRRKAAVQMKGRVLAAMWVQSSELGSKIPSASCLASLPSLPGFGRLHSGRGPRWPHPVPLATGERCRRRWAHNIDIVFR